MQRRGIGWFSADLAGDRWAWSPSLQPFFGELAEDGHPDWAGIVARIHPEDRELVVGAFQQASLEPGPFSWSHRISAADGLLHSILVVGETVTVATADASGHSIRGYAIDLTDLRVQGARTAASEAVQRSAEHRATIEQAKGVVMLAYGLGPDAAFELLVWHSQRSNRKLSVLAADLVEAVQRRDLLGAETRAAADQLLDDVAHSPG